MFHRLTDRSRNNVASVLGINPFFVNDYQQSAQHYSQGKIVEIISLLRVYDLKGKGVNTGSASDGGLCKELIYKILH